jgi:hypothetical protein
MLLINRRRSTDDGPTYERVGKYENGRFTDGYDGPGTLEGEPEESIRRSFDGPHIIAVRPDEEDELP